eukprot:gene9154-10105_t
MLAKRIQTLARVAWATRISPSTFRSFSSQFINEANFNPEEIIDECGNIRASIQTLNDRFKGPLEKSSQKNTVLPFVFLLGNHSSGKSSFINYVLQRKVQTAGVAPTDDTFTVIVPGPSDVDRDGPSFIGDPDMGFAGLRTFGPQLVHHTHLKVRCNIAAKNFMMIDTPGMIDSPMVRDRYGATKHAVMDRGYDFEGVCRWFSERADVILLFFDPDKPGTTGETLSILTNSLVGLDHKLHIILNKADQFKKIHDFARAYGSLCWNLSKVIQRKDLPRIYTMCLPKSYQVTATENGEAASALPRSLADLEETREEVVAAVFNAPKRRVDNEITRLTDSVALLQMHLNVVEDLSKQYRESAFKAKLSLAASLLITSGATGGAIYLQLPIEAAAGIGSVGSAATIGWYLWQQKKLAEQAKDLIKEDALISSYKRLYAKKEGDKDEFLSSLWSRVYDHIFHGLSSPELKALGSVSNSDLNDLEHILDVDIPKLRRRAAPTIHRKL